MIALEVKHLTKKYPAFELKDVNFALPEGTITGFIGANGAGKTTTMKLIGGLARPTSGEIFYFGKPMASLSRAERETLGMTFDEPLFPEKIRLNALEGILKGVFKTWDSHRFQVLCARFGLDPKKRVNELSKGMKAKLNLAIAFSHSMKTLVLDEPANGLDPVAREDLLAILKDFAKKANGTVLVSSHILADLEKICDNMILIQEGAIRFQGSEATIKANYDYWSGEDLTPLAGLTLLATRKDPLSGKLDVLLPKGELAKANLAGQPLSLERLSLLLFQTETANPSIF